MTYINPTLCLLLLLVTEGFGAGQAPQSSYTSWVTSTRARRLVGALPHDEKLELAITIVTGDEANGGKQAVLSTFAVTSGGQLSDQRLTPSGTMGAAQVN